MKYIIILIIGLNLFSSVAKAQDPCERLSYYTGKIGNGDMNDQCYIICADLAKYLCNVPNIAEADRQQYLAVIEVAKSSVRSMNAPGEPKCCEELIGLPIPDFSKSPANGGEKVDFESLAQDLANLGISKEDLLTAGAVAGGLLLLNELAEMIPVRMEPKSMENFKKNNFSYHGLNGDVPYLNIKGKFTDDGFKVTDVSENSQFKNDDIINAISGKDIKLWDELYLELLKNSGKEAEVTILRNNKKLIQTVQVTKPEFVDQSATMPEEFPTRGTIVFPTGAIFYGRLDQGYPRNGTIIYESGVTYTGSFRLERGERGELVDLGMNYLPTVGYFEYPSLGIREYNRGQAYKFSNGDSVKVINPKAYGKIKVAHFTANGKSFESNYVQLGLKNYSQFYDSLPTQEIKRQFVTVGMVELDLRYYRNYTFGIKLPSGESLRIKKFIRNLLPYLDESDPLYGEYLKIIARIQSLTNETKK